MTTDRVRRIGLLINPLAGIGGPLAARGSDVFLSLRQARQLGGKPVAAARAARALARLHAIAPDVEIMAPLGPMGASVARAAGFAIAVLDGPRPGRSTARDTRAAAEAMAAGGVELILFAGGDGTARDIFEVVCDRLPLVGIPTGVKMHSAVFAINPEAAGETAGMAIDRPVGVRSAEIMDSDPVALAGDRPSARLFGYAATPAFPQFLQPAKGARLHGGEAEIEALARRLARQARPGQLILLGPGTTMAAVKHAFGLPVSSAARTEGAAGTCGTLLGVDAVADGAVVAVDADAATLEALCARYSDIVLMVGVVGAQGFVFGRGNQQISPAVLRAVGPGNIRIIATREKLLALSSAGLRADTGDVALDGALQGFYRVETGPVDTMMMRLTTGQ